MNDCAAVCPSPAPGLRPPDRETWARLARICRHLLDTRIPIHSLIPEASALRDILEAHTGFRVAHGADQCPGGTRLESGLAISTTHAALCLREQLRTLAFVRGIGEAVAARRQALPPGEPLRILYAGCGPYALLTLPLMLQDHPESLQITLLEIHPESLERALTLIDSLGLRAFIADTFCGDATTYCIPPDAPPALIVSETLAVALHNEPLVSILRHLAPQAPTAILIPEAVQVDLALVNTRREHTLMPAGYNEEIQGQIPAPARDRQPLGPVFTLNRASILAWGPPRAEDSTLPAATVTLPPHLPTRYQPYLMTRIQVFGNVVLENYDSSLTLPQVMRITPPLEGGERLAFHYQLGPYPELAYQVVPPDVRPSGHPKPPASPSPAL